MTTSMSASSLLCSTSSGAPGSPYRSSSGSLNGLTSRPSLNKELVQKLRSMTETIKILSDENAVVREENQRLRHSSLPREDEMDNYDELTKSQLIALTISYDKKFKAMADELEKMKEVSNEQQMNQRNGQSTKMEKDKYKSLARRLKEERNNYKCALEEKHNEQSVLKDEMEKMSDLISELRENCHKLQSELLHVRRRSASTCERFSDASVQTDHRRTSSARRSSIGSGGSSESVRRARSVYSMSRNNANGRNNPSLGGGAPKPRPAMNFRSQTATSAAKSVTPKTAPRGGGPPSQPGTPKSGPKFAKPVTKPPGQKMSLVESPLKKGSPSKIPIVRGVPRSHTGGGSTKIPTPSKIPKTFSPAPKKSSTPQPHPVKDEEKNESPGVVAATPAIISAEMGEDEDILVVNKDQENELVRVSLVAAAVNKNAFEEEEKRNIHISSASTSSSYSSKDEAEEEFDEEEDDFRRVRCESKDPSADDEGSRDSSVVNSVPCTPKTKKKIENFKQGLAARRVHRTWQHFYEELEERNLPSPGHISQQHQQQPLPSQVPHSFPPKNEGRKYSLPIGELSSKAGFEDDLTEAAIQLKNTYSLKNRIHTARPWLKNKSKSAKELLLGASPANILGEGSSEEEFSMHSPPGGGSLNKAYLRLQADKDLFTSGKVSAIKAVFNERRRLPDRSDGVTDDDDELGM